jgi:hypothetical protein
VLLMFAMLMLAGGALPATASGDTAPGASSEALRIARAGRPGWRLGRLVTRQHDGRRHLEAELLAGGTPVAWFRVDPGSGRLLARGERPARGAPGLEPARLRSQVEQALRGLELGAWAWPTEHGRAWAIPLRWEGRVVGAIKVDVHGARVLAAGADDEDDEDDEDED